MGIVMARGPNFVYAKEFVSKEHGPEVWQQVLDRLPADAAPIWAKRTLITEAHPFSAFKAMLAALVEVIGAQPEEETAKMYSYIADRSLNTVYKFFFRFADPAFVISRYPVLWRRFFDSGRVEVPLAARGRAELRFELDEIFLDWLRPACLGYSHKAIELSGGADAALRDLETVRGDDGLFHIAYELTWTE